MLMDNTKLRRFLARVRFEQTSNVEESPGTHKLGPSNA